MNQNKGLISENTDYQSCISRNPLNDFINEFPCTSMSCSIDVLMEEVKPVVAKKYDFEFRDKLVLSTDLIFLDHRDSDAKKYCKNLPSNPFLQV